MMNVPQRVREWIVERLQWEDWARWLPRTVEIAREEIRRRRWRGKRGGVLPGGHDANSIAAEVIAEVLRGKCRVALGWTPERLEKELRRLTRNVVRRLHKLKETTAVRSEWDIVAPSETGSPRSVFEEMEGRSSGESGAEMLESVRDKAAREAEEKIAASLKGDEARLFSCLRSKVMKRREIAVKLGVSAKWVTNLRKRLERRLEEYGRRNPSCPAWVIEELKGR